MKASIAGFLLCLPVAAVLTALTAPAAQATEQPVKIYVMVGQSNMQGKGIIDGLTTRGTLEYIAANEPATYGFLKDGSGEWVVRDDVWMYYERSKLELKTGEFAVGYAPNHLINFGTTLSDAGLLADGATLWFSMLYKPTSGANSGISIYFGDGEASLNGVGVKIGGTTTNYSVMTNGTATTSLAVADSGGLTLAFTCLKGEARGGLTLNLEFSSDLGQTDPWSSNRVEIPGDTSAVTVNDIDFEISESSGDSSMIDVIATIPHDKAIAGKIFARLSASERIRQKQRKTRIP